MSGLKKMVQGMCARGFIVLSVYHPETGIGTPKLEEAEIIVRGHQNGCQIAKLAELIRKGYFPNIPHEAPIGVMGHSLGGSASVEACRNTSVIKAAINMDGRIMNPTDISQPVLQLIAKQVKEDRTKYNAALQVLAEYNPLLLKQEIDVKHGDFCTLRPSFLNLMIDTSSDFFIRALCCNSVSQSSGRRPGL
jgi:hypothetical protein